MEGVGLRRKRGECEGNGKTVLRAASEGCNAKCSKWHCNGLAAEWLCNCSHSVIRNGIGIVFVLCVFLCVWINGI